MATGVRNERAARGMRATVLAVAASTLLGLAKILAGWIGHSYALIADGVESIADLFASFVVWSGLRVAARPPDRNHPWGHGKAESLAALIVALALVATALGLAVQSVRQILAPHRAPEPWTLAVLAVVVLVKELMHRRLLRVGRETDSTSLAADAWHHRSDALTSLAAFVGISVAVLGGPAFASADAWAALAACAVILWNGGRLLRIATSEVMDEAAPADQVARIRAVAEAQPGVHAVETCRARKSGPGWLVDLHVEVDGGLSVREGHRIGHAVKDALLASEIGVLDALVHVEPAPHAAEDARIRGA